MDNNNQPTSNNQNTGISGFGSANGMPPVDQSNQSPTVPTPPAPTPAPAAQVNQNMPSNTPKQVMMPPEHETDSFAGLSTNQDFAKQSIIGGVDDPKFKLKPVFGGQGEEDVIKQPLPEDMPVMNGNANQPPVYNEITASKSKNNFALIAIIVGVVLLLAAGGGYYYYIYTRQQTEPIQEPVTEIPENNEVIVEDTTIENDRYMLNFNQLEATASAGLLELDSNIKNLDITGIDEEIQSEQAIPSSQEQTPVTEPETPAPLQP